MIGKLHRLEILEKPAITRHTKPTSLTFCRIRFVVLFCSKFFVGLSIVRKCVSTFSSHWAFVTLCELFRHKPHFGEGKKKKKEEILFSKTFFQLTSESDNFGPETEYPSYKVYWGPNIQWSLSLSLSFSVTNTHTLYGMHMCK